MLTVSGVNRSVNSAMSVPSLTEQQTERRAEQVDSLVQALRDLTDGQRATMTAIDGVRQLVEQAMHDQAQQPLDDTLGLLKQTPSGFSRRRCPMPHPSMSGRRSRSSRVATGSTGWCL